VANNLCNVYQWGWMLGRITGCSMANKHDRTAGELAALRQRAEAMLKNTISKTIPSLASENVEALVHELQVHQIELEVQNEELRQSRQQAEESRDQYYDLYEASPSPYITLDRQFRIQRVNGAAERLLGAERRVLVGRRLSEYVDPDAAESVMECWSTVVEGKGPLSCEMKLRCKDGVKFALADVSLVGSPNGVQHLRLTATDITERKLAEERLKAQDRALMEQQQELQSVSARLLSMEQDVRQSVARDLEEEYRQRMAVLIWDLSAIEREEPLTSRGLTKLHEIQQRVSHMGVDLHHLAHRLHSGFLQRGGLQLAMKEYIEDLNTFPATRITFAAPDLPVECHPAKSVALFRVMQEALINVFKHAEATTVIVELKATEEELLLTVRDDGKGFQTAGRATAPDGFGVLIMRERMRAMGGVLTVESRPGEGTTVKASMPLRDLDPPTLPDLPSGELEFAKRIEKPHGMEKEGSS
jgi:PAS domain S-box-containing protein